MEPPTDGAVPHHLLLSLLPDPWGRPHFICCLSSQIPSNLLLKHTRANVYLASIIFLWGICACVFALMRSPEEFYALRLLLGIFEAGAFPGMWYFLSRYVLKTPRAFWNHLSPRSGRRRV